MESTVAAIRVGSALDMGAAISIPAGSHIRAVLPSGKTQTIKGPYTGTVADLAKGQPINEGVTAWIKNILKTGGATESTPGATRSIARPPETPRAAFSWSTIPVADGTVCVEKGAKLRLVRVASAKLRSASPFVDSGNGQQAEAQWEAGSDTADWPSGVAPRADVTYYVLVPDRAAAADHPARAGAAAGRGRRAVRAAPAGLQLPVRGLGARQAGRGQVALVCRG